MARDEHCKCQEQHICDKGLFKADSANQSRCGSTLEYWWENIRTTSSIASASSCMASTLEQQLMPFRQ